MAAPPRTRQRVPQRTKRKPKPSSDVVKLIVVGLSGTGKSEFIRSISQYTEWQAEPGNSWFFGRLRVDRSLLLHFLEPPIDRRFDFMWLREILTKMRATGFIIMMDSTRPQQFGEFLSIVYTIHGYHQNAPMVIAANKQDKHNAWSADDIRLGLGLRDMTVMPCVANDQAYVRDIVLELLYQVLG